MNIESLSAPQTDLYLEKLVWRYRRGWYDAGRVSSELIYQADKLANRTYHLQQHVGFIRKFQRTNFLQLDAIRSSIPRQIGSLEFEGAVRAIKEAKRLLNILETAASFYDSYENIKIWILDIKNIIGEFEFAVSKTGQIILHLKNECEKHLTLGESHKSRFFLQLCESEVKTLLSTSIDQNELEKLKGSLEELRGTLIQFRALDLPDYSAEQYMSKISFLESTLKSDYPNLAARLIDEFKLQLSGLLLFLSEYGAATESIRDYTKKRIAEFKPGNESASCIWATFVLFLIEGRLIERYSALRPTFSSSSSETKNKEK